MSPSPKHELAARAVRTLADAGHEAYFVGGCVRDLVMGIEPADYDIATSARPEAIRGLFDRTLDVGAAFGVVIVRIDGEQFEVATFRSDGGYSDGRHPDRVEFTDAEGDVRRRDFTINGMLYDPAGDCVIDHVGGRQDIADRIIRTIGEPRDRFGEDKLRLLRAVRFAARFEYDIEPQTLEAIVARAAEIDQVSAERINKELVLMLTGPHPDRAVELMAEAGLLQAVLPEVAALRGVEQPPEFHPEGDVFTHTMLMLRDMREPSATLAMGVLLHDAGKPATLTESDRIRFNEHDQAGAEIARRVCRRLKFSSDETELIGELVRRHMGFMSCEQMRESTLKRFLGQPHFDEHLELHRLDCVASHGDLRSWEFCARKLEEFGDEAIHPPPLITGQDLIDMGYEPGPIFTEILDAVEVAQLESEITSRDEAIALVREHFTQR